jgi:hypothetical protein
VSPERRRPGPLAPSTLAVGTAGSTLIREVDHAVVEMLFAARGDVLVEVHALRGGHVGGTVVVGDRRHGFGR